MTTPGDSAATVRAAFSPRVHRVFSAYVDSMLRRRFNAVRLLGAPPPPPDAGRAVVVYGNHPSWYDPLIYLFLSSRFFPGHRGFGPMDGEALKKYAFMKKLGIFGVDQSSRRGAVDFLKISRGLLAEPPVSLWLTPQGQFSDPRERPVRFKPGLGHIARDCDCLIYPVASELVFWNEPRAELLVHFGDPVDSRGSELDDKAWTARLEANLSQCQDRLAAAAIAREPEAFSVLAQGRSGVNPVYDGWRYLKAMVRGERFSASHDDTEAKN